MTNPDDPRVTEWAVKANGDCRRDIGSFALYVEDRGDEYRWTHARPLPDERELRCRVSSDTAYAKVPAHQAHDGRWHSPGPAMGTTACGALVEYRPVERWLVEGSRPAGMNLCKTCFPAVPRE